LRRCCGMDSEAEPMVSGAEMSVRARASQFNRGGGAPPPMPGHMPSTKPQASVGRQNGVDPGRAPAAAKPANTTAATPPAVTPEATKKASVATPATPAAAVAMVAPAADTSKRASTQQQAAAPVATAPAADPRASARPGIDQVIDSGDLEKDVTQWIESVTGERKGAGQTFFEWCKDGQVLCRAVNKVQAGICPRINKSSMPFQQMENVTAFIQACRKLGVLEKDLFSTVDLYEGKNLKSVYNCIFNLGSIIRRTAPTFRGPYLGVAQKAVVADAAREKVTATQSGGFRGDISKEVTDGTSKGRHM